MGSLIAASPCALLERSVFDACGQVIGRVAAVGTRRGELQRIGIEGLGPQPNALRFVPRQRFTVEPDRVVLTA